MKVNIEGIGELRFSFSHHTDILPYRTMVTCRWGETEYRSCAVLAKGDQFQKAKGRRVALGRLLKTGLMELVMTTDDRKAWMEAATFTREQRRQVWEAYFKQHADLRRK